jgi:glycosyltransferase involved in cell wall biosynthesis
MINLKTTLICTVLNEENNIGKLIDSIAKQSILPNEVIIVDGGSEDNTLDILNNKKIQFSKLFNIRVIIKKGNRSMGRNEAIKESSNEIILSTDSGCTLDKNWIKNILKPFKDKSVDVVAGYYKGKEENIFQKCLVPYVLVMDDKVNPKEFLPATRSMVFKKSVWEKIGRFDQSLSHNEDYAFANNLKNKEIKIIFARNAIVYWFPGKDIFQAFKMFFRFSLGDIQAKILRPKVVYLILRYILAAYLIILSLIMKSMILNIFILICFVFYVLWSIFKNYRYVNKIQAFAYLPILQFTSDFAVLFGTSVGYIQRISIKKLLKNTLSYKGIILLILLYILLMLKGIEWGIPGLSHPFNYHMDEWHFSQALRTFLKYGTGSVSGAASIPLYHIVSTLAFLIPFYILKIVNPFLIKSSLDNLPMQHTLFEILRLHTLAYGVLFIAIIYNVFKKFLRFKPLLLTTLFIINPIFLLLSGFYKYDITLIFWIIITLYFLFKFKDSQNIYDFIFAGIACGLALSTKFTAAPLFIGYIFSYFIFFKKYNFKIFLLSFVIVFFVFIVFGIPDMILGKGSYFELLNSTLVQGPMIDMFYNLGTVPSIFLLFKEFPSMFGVFLISLFYISIVYYTFLLLLGVIKKTIFKYRVELLIYILSIVFLLSTILFGIDGGGNRALVLFPFIILLSGLFLKELFSKIKSKLLFTNILYFILILGFALQAIQSYSWFLVKYSNDPRQTSSEWILKNIPAKSSIGLENIPIYQMLPDFLLKEFYSKQYNSNTITRYSYKVISSSDKTFPKYLIITNDYDNVEYLKISPKKDLIEKISSLNYKKIKTFEPNMIIYKMFSDKVYLIIANILPVPVNISIYEK